MLFRSSRSYSHLSHHLSTSRPVGCLTSTDSIAQGPASATLAPPHVPSDGATEKTSRQHQRLGGLGISRVSMPGILRGNGDKDALRNSVVVGLGYGRSKQGHLWRRDTTASSPTTPDWTEFHCFRKRWHVPGTLLQNMRIRSEYISHFLHLPFVTRFLR